MQFHELKRKTKLKKNKMVGRGGKRGKTSGRGTKGQNARAGRKKRPESRDIIKRFPKLRGYAFSSIQEKPIVVSLSKIEAAFSDGENVSVKNLIEKGIVESRSGKIPSVKILDGEIKKKIILSGCAVSAKVKEKIEKAGGEISQKSVKS